MREELLAKTVQLLHSLGFTVSSFLEFNSCIDIAAKKNDSAFIIKVLSNIDSLRPETAMELHKAAAIFHATPIILGEKTKTVTLETNTRYERFGIPVFSKETFTDFLYGKNPMFRSFKGKQTVQLDAQQLVLERQKKQLSQQELGEKIGVTTQTIHRYENGHPADAQDAQKIESLLSCRIISPQTIQSESNVEKIFETHFSEPALEKLFELGVPLAQFEHAPFKAVSTPTESLLINLGKDHRDIHRKALILEKTKTVFKAHSIVISKEYKLHNIGQTTIIAEEELESYSKIQELLKEIQKQEQKNEKKTTF
ncbi:MAG: helix-turn-helix domain-containing protein [Candidatus Diapherotrites archaeon]|uniref:Putative HTH-type transcriptional regulatory protein J4215_00075 n=1 Tax=Candidatus Iainarchaeum sp. TaxID=3101447 RepID=A0A8T4L857_9ARCH|nr:helix-turn-helix domain-containing protein [Candidatus Diapherotrites archaeon]